MSRTRIALDPESEERECKRLQKELTEKEHKLRNLRLLHSYQQTVCILPNVAATELRDIQGFGCRASSKNSNQRSSCGEQLFRMDWRNSSNLTPSRNLRCFIWSTPSILIPRLSISTWKAENSAEADSVRIVNSTWIPSFWLLDSRVAIVVI